MANESGVGLREPSVRASMIMNTVPEVEVPYMCRCEMPENLILIIKAPIICSRVTRVC